MSHPRPRKPRPLGSLRHISKTTPDKLPPIPRIHPELSPDSEKLKGGIHGNAMTLPPPPESVKDSGRRSSEDKPKSDSNSIRPPKSSRSSSSNVSHENCEKEIKDGLTREKDLKDQVGLLQKQIEELKVALRGSEQDNKSLREQLESQTRELTQQLGEEKSSHEMTKVSLTSTQAELDSAHERLGALAYEHRAQMDKQKEELEKRLSDTVAEKDAIIADRDHKLSRLKSQMADALKGNSWERQQQLEELTKELSRIQEEADLLRMRIKSMGKNKQSHCSNCDENNAKVTKLHSAIKERDETIKELKALCSKFESQLNTQDKLLEQWAHSKGHKIAAPK